MSTKDEAMTVSPNDSKPIVIGSGERRWGKWECPFCNAEHSDPDDIFETTCKNGHTVLLGIVEDNGVRMSFEP